MASETENKRRGLQKRQLESGGRFGVGVLGERKESLMPVTAIRRPIASLLAALALVVSSIAVAPSARAAVVCGDTATANVVLDADLVCSGTHGIIVGAGGITIDLNGFTIRNTGGGLMHGVDVTGYDDVKVTNGNVRDFYRGVIFENVSNGHASDLNIRGGGGAGLIFSHASDSTATNIDARDFPDAGVDVAHSTRVTLSSVTARRAAWGIFIVNSVGTVVADSDLRRNFFGISVLEGNGNTIRDSILKNNSIAGLGNEAATKTNLISSEVSRNETGVLFIEGGDGSAILDSRITRNGVGIQLGKDIGPSGFPTPSDATDVRVRRNIIRNNDAAGIAVDQAATHSQEHSITANRVVGNGLNPGSHVDSNGQILDDGINVLAPGGQVEIGDNLANSNGDYGIYAPGQSDLGDNIAGGNGNPAQCAGVSC